MDDNLIHCLLYEAEGEAELFCQHTRHQCSRPWAVHFAQTSQRRPGMIVASHTACRSSTPHKDAGTGRDCSSMACNSFLQRQAVLATVLPIPHTALLRVTPSPEKGLGWQLAQPCLAVR